MRRIYANVSTTEVHVPDLGLVFYPGDAIDLMKHVEDTPTGKAAQRIDQSSDLRTAVKMSWVKRDYEAEKNAEWSETRAGQSKLVKQPYKSNVSLGIIKTQLKQISKTEVPDRYAPVVPDGANKVLSMLSPSPVIVNLKPVDRGVDNKTPMGIETLIDVKPVVTVQPTVEAVTVDKGVSEDLDVPKTGVVIEPPLSKSERKKAGGGK